MTDYLDIKSARAHPGIRLVLSAGTPGPWGEAIKGLLHIKKIPFARVAQDPGGENPELIAWTGQRNAPQLIDEDDRAIHTWADLIHFAERREPTPALIPDDIDDRVLMFGLIHEIAGEDGFGWNRRYALLAPIIQMNRANPNPAFEGVVRMAESYGYGDEAAAAAQANVIAVLEMLTRRLQAQKQRGSAYFIGERISALDVYWAVFAAIVAPLPEELCAMPGYLRKSYSTLEPVVAAALSDTLLAHRDAIYRDHLELPLQI
jgi:glutathione S-transferase